VNTAPTIQAAVRPELFQRPPSIAITSPFILGLDSPSANGKSTLQQLLFASPPYLRPYPTFVTRSPRANDGSLVRHVSDDAFDAYSLEADFITYVKGDGRVGFDAKAAVEACFVHGAVSLVVTDINVIRHVKRVAQDAGVRAFFVYLTTSPQLRMNRLHASGCTIEAAQARTARDAIAHRAIRASHPIYDAVISNEGSLQELHNAVLSALTRAGLVAS
jgi:guanylate kinase